MEALWLTVVVLVPLAFLGRSYGEWSSIIGSYEIPKITILRTSAGLIAILWLLEWALRSGPQDGAGPKWSSWAVQPALWPRKLGRWLSAEPIRWLTLAVILFFGSTLLSTALSTSHAVSLWGDIPGQDSYSAYTVVSYGLLFAVVATHLKTEAQLWRLVGAIVLMGVLAGGYAVLQHYGWDFLDLIEPFGHTRSTSTFGRTVFAGAILMMTIPVTTVAAARSLTGRMTVPRFALIAAAGAMVLSVQILGTIFITSRGPWVGTLAGLAALLGLVAAFAGWRQLSRAALVLALGAALSIGVLVSPLQSIADRAAERQAHSGFESLGAGEVSQRLTSIGGQVAGGGLAGRMKIWDNTWEVMTERPWFGFDHLSLSFLRPLIGYGPEQFRTTYLLVSPPNPSQKMLPNEVAHPHNFFLHQGVETGFLGLFTSAGLYLAVFASGGYIWLRQRNTLPGVHKLVLAGLLATVAGRLLEQTVEVARVSDLMVFWVLLAMFAALPVIFAAPIGAEHAGREPSREEPSIITQSRPGRGPFPHRRLPLKWLVKWLVKWLAVAGLIVGLALLTWTKNINYVRAAVIVDQAAAEFRIGELERALSSIGQSIDLSPDVSTYYSRWSEVYWAHPSADPVPQCGEPREVTVDRLCLARQAYALNTQWLTRRPYDFRARLALADSGMDLGVLTDDSEIQAQSARFYREAAEMVPNSWTLWNRLGEVLLGLERPEAALDALDNSLAVTGPSSVHAVRGLILQGTAYRQLGQHEDSVRSLDQAVLANPRFSTAFLERSLTNYQRGQVDRALLDLNKAILLDGQDAQAYYLRGRIYYEMGRLKSAVADLTDAISFDSKLTDAWNSRGLAEARLGRLGLAIKDFSAAIRLDPELAVAFNNRGFAYRDTGQLESALQDLDRAIELDPGLAISYYNRALVHVLLGKDSEARQDGQRAVVLGIDASTLKEAITQLETRP
jgi:tetratricopeptide (TPR) repeat protein